MSKVDETRINQWIASVQKIVGERGRVTKEEQCDCLLKIDISFSESRESPYALFKHLYGDHFDRSHIDQLIEESKKRSTDTVHIEMRCECFNVHDSDGDHVEYYLCDPGRCVGPYPYCSA